MQCNGLELMGCAASSVNSDGRNKGRNIEINGKSRRICDQRKCSFIMTRCWVVIVQRKDDVRASIILSSSCVLPLVIFVYSLVDLGGAPWDKFYLISWGFSLNVPRYIPSFLYPPDGNPGSVPYVYFCVLIGNIIADNKYVKYSYVAFVCFFPCNALKKKHRNVSKLICVCWTFGTASREHPDYTVFFLHHNGYTSLETYSYLKRYSSVPTELSTCCGQGSNWDQAFCKSIFVIDNCRTICSRPIELN